MYTRGLAVLLGTAALITAAPAHAAAYRYDGNPNAPLGRFTVELDSAKVSEGHVAIWYGVSAGKKWLQAGIGSVGASPYLYVERDGRMVWLEVVDYGRPAEVTIGCNEERCALTFRGRTYRIRLPKTRLVFLGGESYGDNTYRGRAGPLRVGRDR